MIGLNHAGMEPAEAREALRVSRDESGLAPGEAEAGGVRNRKTDDRVKYADKDVADVCTRCHSMGRIISQRRTRAEWELLIAMHRGYIRSPISRRFAGAARRRPSPVPTGGRRITGIRWKR